MSPTGATRPARRATATHAPTTEITVIVKNAELRAPTVSSSPTVGGFAGYFRPGINTMATNIPAASTNASPVGSGVKPRRSSTRANHGVGDREQDAHDDAERDDADRGTDVLLNGAGEQLMAVFVITAGELRLGVLACALVVHRGADQRLDHHPAEGEGHDAGDRTGNEISDSRARFRQSVAWEPQ